MTAKDVPMDGVSGQGPRPSPDPDAAMAAFAAGENSSSPAPPPVSTVVLAALAALGALSIAAPAPAGTPVELELVLAVDASSSVDDAEFALQMRGIAAAFRDADVQAAIDCPRVFRYGEVLEVERGVGEDTIRALAALGHETAPAPAPLGGGQAIRIDWQTGALTGGSDPRKDGGAMGY